MDKLCRDCGHFLPDGARCAKSPQKPDFVNGGERGFYSAQTERESVHGCGAEGRWWEPRVAT